MELEEALLEFRYLAQALEDFISEHAPLTKHDRFLEFKAMTLDALCEIHAEAQNAAEAIADAKLRQVDIALYDIKHGHQRPLNRSNPQMDKWHETKGMLVERFSEALNREEYFIKRQQRAERKLEALSAIINALSRFVEEHVVPPSFNYLAPEIVRLDEMDNVRRQP